MINVVYAIRHPSTDRNYYVLLFFQDSEEESHWWCKERTIMNDLWFGKRSLRNGLSQKQYFIRYSVFSNHTVKIPLAAYYGVEILRF